MKKAPQDGCSCPVCVFLRAPAKGTPVRPGTVAWDDLLRPFSRPAEIIVAPPAEVEDV